jgi:hypothetical protein
VGVRVTSEGSREAPRSCIPIHARLCTDKNVRRGSYRAGGLTPSQRAAIAVEFLPQLEAEAKRRQRAGLRRGIEPAAAEGRPSGSPEPNGTSSHRAREEAGALVAQSIPGL